MVVVIDRQRIYTINLSSLSLEINLVTINFQLFCHLIFSLNNFLAVFRSRQFCLFTCTTIRIIFIKSRKVRYPNRYFPKKETAGMWVKLKRETTDDVRPKRLLRNDWTQVVLFHSNNPHPHPYRGTRPHWHKWRDVAASGKPRPRVEHKTSLYCM